MAHIRRPRTKRSSRHVIATGACDHEIAKRKAEQSKRAHEVWMRQLARDAMYRKAAV